jgi:LysM repeat protein
MLRRRIAALLTVTFVVLALCGAWALRSDASQEAGVVEATVVVAPGQTVWDIATDYVPEGQHPQAYVAEVLRYNALDAAAVAPGTVLRLPRS